MSRRTRLLRSTTTKKWYDLLSKYYFLHFLTMICGLFSVPDKSSGYYSLWQFDHASLLILSSSSPLDIKILSSAHTYRFSWYVIFLHSLKVIFFMSVSFQQQSESTELLLETEESDRSTKMTERRPNNDKSDRVKSFVRRLIFAVSVGRTSNLSVLRVR